MVVALVVEEEGVVVAVEVEVVVVFVIVVVVVMKIQMNAWYSIDYISWMDNVLHALSLKTGV